jgi:hypothetical protein
MVTGQVSETEYVMAHELHRRPIVTVLNNIWICLIAIGAVVFAMVSHKWGVVTIGGAIGGFIGEFAQARFMIRAKLRRLYQQTKGRTDVTYSWDDEKVRVQSVHGFAERAWGDIHKARENDEVMLLYFNDSLFEVLAKRWFDASQLTAFRSHLKWV